MSKLFNKVSASVAGLAFIAGIGVTIAFQNAQQGPEQCTAEELIGIYTHNPYPSRSERIERCSQTAEASAEVDLVGTAYYGEGPGGRKVTSAAFKTREEVSKAIVFAAVYGDKSRFAKWHADLETADIMASFPVEFDQEMKDLLLWYAVVKEYPMTVDLLLHTGASEEALDSYTCWLDKRGEQQIISHIPELDERLERCPKSDGLAP